MLTTLTSTAEIPNRSKWPRTQEQANTQPCGDLVLALWFAFPVILQLHFQVPISSLSSSPDSLLVPHHCTAQYFFDLHFFWGTYTVCILYLVPLPVVLIYIVKAAIVKAKYFMYRGYVCQTNTSKGSPGAGVPPLARNHLWASYLQSSTSVKASSSISTTAHGGCNITWLLLLKISTFPVLCMLRNLQLDQGQREYGRERALIPMIFSPQRKGVFAKPRDEPWKLIFGCHIAHGHSLSN